MPIIVGDSRAPVAHHLIKREEQVAINHVVTDVSNLDMQGACFAVLKNQKTSWLPICLCYDSEQADRIALLLDSEVPK